MCSFVFILQCLPYVSASAHECACLLVSTLSESGWAHWWEKKQECSSRMLVVLLLPRRNEIASSVFPRDQSISNPFQTIEVCFLARWRHLSLQKQTCVAMLSDWWQRPKRSFWGFNLGSCFRAVGKGGLKWKLIQCEMGLEANPPDLSKSKTFRTQKKVIVGNMCRRWTPRVATISGCWQHLHLLSPHYYFFLDEISTKSIREH